MVTMGPMMMHASPTLFIFFTRFFNIIISLNFLMNKIKQKIFGRMGLKIQHYCLWQMGETLLLTITTKMFFHDTKIN